MDQKKLNQLLVEMFTKAIDEALDLIDRHIAESLNIPHKDIQFVSVLLRRKAFYQFARDIITSPLFEGRQPDYDAIETLAYDLDLLTEKPIQTFLQCCREGFVKYAK